MTGQHRGGGQTAREQRLSPLATEASSQKFDFHQSITISQDYTKASHPEKRKLIVLHGSTEESTKEIVQAHNLDQKHPASTPSGLHGADQILQMRIHQLEQDVREQIQMEAVLNKKASASLRRRDAVPGSIDAGVEGTAASDHRIMAEESAAEKPPGTETAPDNLELGHIEKQIVALQRLRDSFNSTRIQIFYTIDERAIVYLDKPSWSFGSDGSPTLVAKSPVSDTSRFLERSPEVAFAVYKNYDVHHQYRAVKEAHAKGLVLPDPLPVSEAISLVSKQMKEAMSHFRKVHHPQFKDEFPDWHPSRRMNSPFLFWYRFRGSPLIDTMPDHHQQQVRLLTDWIDSQYEGVYASGEAKFHQGQVSNLTMPFFVRPGDVLVKMSSHHAQDHASYVAQSWPFLVPDKAAKLGTDDDSDDDDDNDSEDSHDSDAEKGTSGHHSDARKRWQVKVWSYSFNGRFYRSSCTLDIDLLSSNEDPDMHIRKLKYIPLRFADPAIYHRLMQRGRMMWTCRHKKLVAYEGGDNDTHGRKPSGDGDRYMIDVTTYKELHSHSAPLSLFHAPPDGVEMDPRVMARDEPPPEPDLLVLPGTIVGYNLRQKKWRDLHVFRIQDVVWNKDAFQHLVIDSEIKDIIEALVTSKTSAEQGTDLIQGKGNGLIILLHGSPGTGKTFTAESVAELAEKPLFRVTCGDIGTKPEQVEKYLESVLHLGKIWGCVVLLDEADVFLEQRALTDLERNALVSVFLRVIEYYEGILILTSNRVSTFDEAFKSRILLPLHYKPLNLVQRRQIWDNFLQRLRTTEDATSSTHTIERMIHEPKRRKTADVEPMDFEGIRKHLGDLAKIEMNGRQIRNAITTARQLARFKDETMKYHHLEHVISVTQRFDEYLEKEHNAPDDSTLAWGKGL